MNIANALNAALPELPERLIQRGVPKLDPRVIARQQVEAGKPTVLAKLPGAENFIRLDPAQWVLLQSFNGERSYAEISTLVTAQSGVAYTEENVREFAAFIQGNTDLFYRSALEKNISLHQKLRGQRIKRNRFKLGDFSDISIVEWPDADSYIDRIYPYLRWIYTRWFTLLALVMFLLMGLMWAGRFGEIWRDSFEFYNFTTKSGRDLFEFWVLFGAMAFFHESFHGLTCKHFGGSVERMGFTLMYFAPSFFCDVTQIWIFGGKWQRIATVIAGIWGDLILCFFATAIWWATAPGMLVHDLAYKIMMVTGIGVSLLNLNPLIKLDGYYIFCELIGEPDFKERTSAYLSAWTRKYLFGMPAEIEYLRHWQRAFFLIYAVLSAIYGYLLLSFLMVFGYNVAHSYSTAWAFLPALLAGYWVFRAKIHGAARFAKLLYLDKKERVSAWLTPTRLFAFGLPALLLLFLPVWPDFEDASYVVEPAKQAFLHAPVKGQVAQVFVDEGESVAPGQILMRLENLELQSELARVQADLQVASARATQTQLHYGDFSSAQRERERLVAQSRALADEAAKLEIRSPIGGQVATSRLRDLSNSYVEEGTPLAEVIDDASLRARIYVPEFAMHDVHIGEPVRLGMPSRVVPVSTFVDSISPDWVPLDPALGEKQQLAGINPPRFYSVESWIGGPSTGNARDLRPGMTGMAKIQVGKRSLAALILRFGRDLIARRLW